jgi:hypothetical protein
MLPLFVGPAPLFAEPAVAGCVFPEPLVLPAWPNASGDKDIARATANSLFMNKLSYCFVLAETSPAT